MSTAAILQRCVPIMKLPGSHRLRWLVKVNFQVERSFQEFPKYLPTESFVLGLKWPLFGAFNDMIGG